MLRTFELLHFPIIFMNRLNKTESAVSSFVGSLFLKNPLINEKTFSNMTITIHKYDKNTHAR